ncbi:MAG: hypothetical protein GXO37_04680, partial [Chloroflexi bacterium]|nr:hypothetical protein [Chloroflexota bacterium]
MDEPRALPPQQEEPQDNAAQDAAAASGARLERPDLPPLDAVLPSRAVPLPSDEGARADEPGPDA